jgi:acyl-CoA thioester hydrolase
MISVREKVRFVETEMLGVVHHSNYFRWFEIARVEYLKKAGIELLSLLADDILFPVTEVNCNYIASARFGDDILIEAELKEVSKVKMVFSYKVIREKDGTLLATGQTQNVFTTLAKGVTRLPDKYYQKLVESFN